MSNAGIHQQDGFQWFIDGGTLTIEKTEGGDGTFQLEPIQEKVMERTFRDPCTDDWEVEETLRTVGYVKPWSERWDEVVRLRVGDGITEIHKEAFSNAKALQSVSLPQSLVRIQSSAFQGCEKLETIEWREDGNAKRSRGSIDDLAFADCKSLTSVAIPEGFEKIGKYAFGSCYELCSIQLPASLRTIGYGAFSLCSLKDVTLPEGLKSVGGSAFSHNDTLERINIPASVEDIGEGAIGQKSLREVTLPRAFKKNRDIFCFYELRYRDNARLSLPFKIHCAKPPKAPTSSASGNESDKPSLLSRLFGKK